MNSIQELYKILIQKFYAHTDEHVFTVAISGIDASGKGLVTKLLENELKKQGLKTANINIDLWQNSIPVRLQKENAAENFYQHAFRWNDFFHSLLYHYKKTGAFISKPCSSEFMPMSIIRLLITSKK